MQYFVRAHLEATAKDGLLEREFLDRWYPYVPEGSYTQLAQIPVDFPVKVRIKRKLFGIPLNLSATVSLKGTLTIFRAE